jgi:hypothetical protein
MRPLTNQSLCLGLRVEPHVCTNTFELQKPRPLCCLHARQCLHFNAVQIGLLRLQFVCSAGYPSLAIICLAWLEIPHALSGSSTVQHSAAPPAGTAARLVVGAVGTLRVRVSSCMLACTMGFAWNNAACVCGTAGSTLSTKSNSVSRPLTAARPLAATSHPLQGFSPLRSLN